jgi:hypothetical protein
MSPLIHSSGHTAISLFVWISCEIPAFAMAELKLWRSE